MQEFVSYLEDPAPTVFFAPDFGEPGGDGYVTGPGGTTTPLANPVLTDDVRSWPGDVQAKGMGFVVPTFTEVGDHVVTITQADADGNVHVTSYLVHVLHDPTRYTEGA